MSQTAVAAAPPSKAILWTSRVLSALPILTFLLSAAMKLSHAPQLVEKFTGIYLFREGLVTPIGLLELACTIVYVIPRTAVLGAVLLTAYLGGAVVTHVRAGEPFVLPVLLGALVWAGLYLRDNRVRALVS